VSSSISTPTPCWFAVVLSAQATDAGVNKATRAPVRGGRYAAKDAGTRRGKSPRIHQDHRALSQQGENVIALSEKLIAQFGSEVPRTRNELESLPGAGRKTANVVLNMAFGEYTMAVDTHVFRVGNRTGLAPGDTPLEVELGLERVIPPEFHAARASLADPARPLHLPRAQATLRGMPAQRSLPLAGKDGLRHHRRSYLTAAFGTRNLLSVVGRENERHASALRSIRGILGQC